MINMCCVVPLYIYLSYHVFTQTMHLRFMLLPNDNASCVRNAVVVAVSFLGSYGAGCIVHLLLFDPFPKQQLAGE
jgi:hypothetical protein